jgi:hypothetical protein
VSVVPTEEFEILWYAPRNGVAESRFDTFEAGVEAAYGYLKDPLNTDFALTVGPVDRTTPVPSLVLERMPDAVVLVQIYVPEAMSPAGEDGWYTLVRPPDFDQVTIQDVSVIGDGTDPTGKVETRIAEGALLSRRMYVPCQLAEEALKLYLETRDLNQALKQKPWKFVGLI